jgi:Spy/CpxP family protein refolding chaperone
MVLKRTQAITAEGGNMKKFYLIALAVLLLGVATVVFAAADTGSPERQGHHGFRGHHDFLNLSNEQVAKMREIRERFRADTHDLRYDIRLKMVEMRKLFTDPKTDEATLAAKQKELQGLIVKLMDRRAQMKLEWRRVLTPEQIAMLDRPHRHHRFFRDFDFRAPGRGGPAGG